MALISHCQLLLRLSLEFIIYSFLPIPNTYVTLKAPLGYRHSGDDSLCREESPSP